MKTRLLLIDDCEMMQRFIKPVLESEFEVITVSTGMEAILYLRNENFPDIILLDFNLPEMTGLEVLTAIRENDKWAGIPVVMLSGVKDSEKRWQCLEVGANDFLAKPFHPRELNLRVKLALKQQPVFKF